MVIKMNKNANYIQVMMLLITVSFYTMIRSAEPLLVMLFMGLLMIVFTERSLSDKDEKLLFAIQVFLSVIFVVVVGQLPLFLIFYECRFGKRKWLPICYPSIAYLVFEGVMQREELPYTICNVLILAAISGVLRLTQWLIGGYLSARAKISHAVTVSAVNEMYEKKLNRELTMKNYLADKNARLEERENISRNIHNSVGHSITAAIMTLDAADMLFDTAPDKAREKMNVANERIRNSLSVIRHAVRVLDNGSEFIAMSDLLKELNAVVDSFIMDTAVTVHIDLGEVDDSVSVPHEHTEFLTGAVQELLTNGVRHGGASLFMLRIMGDSGHIKLNVSDNGNSKLPKEDFEERIQNGFGLKKLISYTQKCGGTATFRNENGFGVELMMPLIKEELSE